MSVTFNIKKPSVPVVSNTVFIPAQQTKDSGPIGAAFSTQDTISISTQTSQLKPVLKLTASMTHKNIQKALKSALKDGSINAYEASEIRSLLLDLPKAERQSYQPHFMQYPMTKYASHIILDIDVDMNKYRNDFLQEDLKLIDSTPFKRVFPNFNYLSLQEKKTVVKELKPYLKFWPTLLPQLNKINNNNLGKGFQFYFLNKELDKEVGSIIPKGAGGVIWPGSNVVKNPLMRLVTKPILGMKIFDRGGMFNSGIKYGVFAHEVAHIIHMNMLNDDQRDQLTNLYNKAWNNHEKTDGKKGFVSGYAMTNTYEYLADSMEAYLLHDKARLKAKDPEMYAWLDNMLKEGKTYNGKDGNLFNDPEKVSYISSFQGGKVLHGISISRDSHNTALKHFEASTPTEIAVMGGDKSVMIKGSVGLKASWKPWTQPFGVYGTVGATAQGGVFNGKPSIGAGGYVGAGVDYKFINIEARHNFMAGANTPTHNTEIRAGVRFEF